MRPAWGCRLPPKCPSPTPSHCLSQRVEIIESGRWCRCRFVSTLRLLVPVCIYSLPAGAGLHLLFSLLVPVCIYSLPAGAGLHLLFSLLVPVCIYPGQEHAAVGAYETAALPRRVGAQQRRAEAEVLPSSRVPLSTLLHG